MKGSFKEKKGITLIALVITIIVLLILAGVSIAMLTGQKGILTQANNAKNATELASAKEKVELAVIGAISQTRDGTLKVGNLRTELANYGGTIEGEAFLVTATVDGKSFAVDGNGNVVSTENVTDGIIVEDVSHSATKGSQFVWIPVGEVVKEIKDEVKSIETITLSRYTFADDNVGTPTDKGATEIENSYNNNYKHTEINTAPNGNITAKENIESEESGFRKSVKDNHGYYIGRYESRKNGTQVTVKASDTVYNNITQPNAATVSRGMYSDSNFKSDLMNSYAWDTAIVFLQKFDNRANKASLKPYSRQNSLNDSLASQGTNNLSDASKQDVVCNVYDMASNCWEWTTETYSDPKGPCTRRGGSYFSSKNCTRLRNYNDTDFIYDDVSFRPLLYI